MTLQELLPRVTSTDIDKLITLLDVSKFGYTIQKALGLTTAQISKDLKQYNPKDHDVHNIFLRKNKPLKDKKGNLTGQYTLVNRLSLPEQKRIVMSAAMFLGSPELSSTAKKGLETDFVTAMELIHDENKMDYKFKDLMESTMSERECAELWYTPEADPGYWDDTVLKGAKYKVKVHLLSPTRGDTLYPVFDPYGDMIAFGRMYETSGVSEVSMTTETIVHFDLYTKDKIYYLRKSKTSGVWQEELPVVGEKGQVTYSVSTEKAFAGVINPIGKIPVSYYSQPLAEWSDVQPLIERLETKISNHADTNDYFDSPILFVNGTITGFSAKAEQGKVLEAGQDAKLQVITWDSAPESMKMEITNLIDFIDKYSHTPNFTFQNVKGLGDISGIALKLLFMDAHMKASEKEKIFGPGVQRRINYLKAVIVYLKVSYKPASRVIIKPKFTYFLPKDVDGEIKNLVAAVGAGIISQQTAVRLNPLVEDPISEMLLIKAEQTQKTKDKLKLAQSTAKTKGDDPKKAKKEDEQ